MNYHTARPDYLLRGSSGNFFLNAFLHFYCVRVQNVLLYRFSRAASAASTLNKCASSSESSTVIHRFQSGTLRFFSVKYPSLKLTKISIILNTII